jgi:hypothetical protein
MARAKQAKPSKITITIRLTSPDRPGHIAFADWTGGCGGRPFALWLIETSTGYAGRAGVELDSVNWSVSMGTQAARAMGIIE